MILLRYTVLFFAFPGIIAQPPTITGEVKRLRIPPGLLGPRLGVVYYAPRRDNPQRLKQVVILGPALDKTGYTRVVELSTCSNTRPPDWVRAMPYFPPDQIFYGQKTTLPLSKANVRINVAYAREILTAALHPPASCCVMRIRKHKLQEIEGKIASSPDHHDLPTPLLRTDPSLWPPKRGIVYYTYQQYWGGDPSNDQKGLTSVVVIDLGFDEDRVPGYTQVVEISNDLPLSNMNDGPPETALAKDFFSPNQPFYLSPFSEAINLSKSDLRINIAHPRHVLRSQLRSPEPGKVTRMSETKVKAIESNIEVFKKAKEASGPVKKKPTNPTGHPIVKWPLAVPGRSKSF